MLDWKVQGHANEIWWVMDHGRKTRDLVSSVEERLTQRPAPEGPNHGNKKVHPSHASAPCEPHIMCVRWRTERRLCAW